MTEFDRRDLAFVIREALRNRHAARIPDESGKYRHAGVLVPLLREDGMCRLLFTKRTREVETHKGQISFPGGKVDPHDGSAEETALREAREEIGLLAEDVEILGRMDDARTLISNFVIHPFVGLVPFPYAFKMNKWEVERVITVPLAVFQPGNAETIRPAVEYEGTVYRTSAYEYRGDVIWGATARIVENFMRIIGHKLVLPGREK